MVCYGTLLPPDSLANLSAIVSMRFRMYWLGGYSAGPIYCRILAASSSLSFWDLLSVVRRLDNIWLLRCSSSRYDFIVVSRSGSCRWGEGLAVEFSSYEAFYVRMMRLFIN
jgi:hypothetical protein